MKNIEIIEFTSSNGTTEEFVIIDRGNGEYTSMSKVYYDELATANEAKLLKA
jgi:hypothetical protein